MTLDELKGVAFEAGLPGYAAKQMADWLYKKKVTSIAAMTNIASAKRALLEKNFEVGAVPPSPPGTTPRKPPPPPPAAVCGSRWTGRSSICILPVLVILLNPCTFRRKTGRHCVFPPRSDVK